MLHAPNPLGTSRLCVCVCMKVRVIHAFYNATHPPSHPPLLCINKKMSNYSRYPLIVVTFLIHTHTHTSQMWMCLMSLCSPSVKKTHGCNFAYVAYVQMIPCSIIVWKLNNYLKNPRNFRSKYLTERNLHILFFLLQLWPVLVWSGLILYGTYNNRE